MFPPTGSRRAGNPRRPAFTLIEMLVVIAIIAVLGTLTAGVVLKFMTGQPITNTKVGLKKMQTMAHKRWVEVTEQAKREAIQGVYLTAVQSLSSDSATQRVIYIKIKQKQAFPETFFEAINPLVIGSGASAVTIPAVPGYVQFLKNNAITTGSQTAPQNYESAVCLLMALKRSVSGGTINDQDLGLTPSINTTIVPGGAPCLCDGWGNPIGFCRWPLGNPNATAGDPTDPGKLLENNNNWTATGKATFGSTIHVIGTTAAPGNLTPMLASAGSSSGVLNQILTVGQPGTLTQWSIPAANAAAANSVIYSNNLP